MPNLNRNYKYFKDLKFGGLINILKCLSDFSHALMILVIKDKLICPEIHSLTNNYTFLKSILRALSMEKLLTLRLMKALIF